PGAVPAEADLVVVGNPASPSGTLDPAAAVLALRRPGRVVVVDEAFMDLVPGEPATLAGDPLDDVIVVRSLTKALAVPGLRVGAALRERAIAVRPAASFPGLNERHLRLTARDPQANARLVAALAEAVR